MNPSSLRFACAWLALAACLPSARAEDDDIRSSVVKIMTTQRGPDWYQPWTRQSPEESGGTGFIIEGQRILTNHHVICYASQIYVQPHHSAERIRAKVVAGSPEMDLAILELEDESFFAGRKALELDGATRVKAAVNVYGYPIGGDELSVTEGIISRIEYTDYYYETAGLQIQIDAAINPGNSGGPAISGGKVLGVAFRGIFEAENIGYLIAAEEVRTFLDDVADGTYDGKPQLLNAFQPTDNDALRESLKLPKSVGGCLVTRITSRDAAYPLHVGDVVTHIGPHEVDQRGQVARGDDARVFFTYYVRELAREGRVPLTVFRDGASVPLQVPLVTGRDRVIPMLKDAYPDYVILGPLVFSTASEELVDQLLSLREWADYLANAGSPLVTRTDDTEQFEGERLVVLAAPPFSHRISKGYANHNLIVLESVNSVAVKNLAHLVELVRDSREEFLKFTFAEKHSPQFVFRRQELLDATEEILVDNGIRNRCSPELEAVWTKK